MDDVIPTQPRPEPVTAACLALTAALLGSTDLDVRLAAGGALATLNNVHPPYPPLDDPENPLPVDEALSTAAAHLEAAIDEADTAQEAVRFGFALTHLLELDDVPELEQPDL